MNGTGMEGQPLPGGKAEVAVWVGTLVTVVDVRVEMNIVFTLRTKLLATV